MTDTVLVTGISGYIGSHVAAKLLEKGYAVRGSVRNKVKGQRIVDALEEAGSDISKLSLVEADLEQDKGWAEATKGCRFIQHIASPFPLEAPSDREALVPAARAGAQRVLEHGFSAGVERIVMTSSLVSMMGQPGRSKKMIVTESDWSDPEWKPLTAYPVSKTRAELSAWAYTKAQDLTDQLTTVCPGIVLGPDPYQNGGASMGLIKAMFEGDFPRAPKIAYPIIDIRDCASIHVAAMTADKAGGRRLMAAGQTYWLAGIANVLKEAYPTAEKLPKGEFPNILVRIISLFDDRVKGILPDLGIFHEADYAYVTSMTGVIPRPSKDAILAAAASLIENGEVNLQ
ncbi:nucleoside-diphosphate-sugar epimerase [Litorimonas taeanensis]|uniref:Nucleoside-diphosphate-sugar epimerase n=1 Tax=Litorimonas taeanensis TaxID=568099 RepID=A0A420WIM8_9PROT|nr:NAD-dependent epimerase/dehydratase family protein [Litorimonas taeanensis]RKQ70806.1 nucleoside-diphosphate-sugar epimerase [Litorimonas taeanensis]